MSLVKEAIAIREEARRKGKSFDFCWLVFDKVLHFKLNKGPLNRSRYASLLTKHLGMEYSKKSGFAATLYNMIKPFQDSAIKNAQIPMEEMKDIKPSMAESSTTVHELVMKLNEFVD